MTTRNLKDLGRLALRGGIVSLAMQYGNGALQIAASIILARLLTPEDFGLVAIVTVLTSFAPMVDRFWPRGGHGAKKQDNAKPDQQPVLVQYRDRA